MELPVHELHCSVQLISGININNSKLIKRFSYLLPSSSKTLFAKTTNWGLCANLIMDNTPTIKVDEFDGLTMISLTFNVILCYVVGAAGDKTYNKIIEGPRSILTQNAMKFLDTLWTKGQKID